jgi:hypothetical protein
VIGELTFSKPLGFLEKGGDIDGIIEALEHMLDYSGKVINMDKSYSTLKLIKVSARSGKCHGLTICSSRTL